MLNLEERKDRLAAEAEERRLSVAAQERGLAANERNLPVDIKKTECEMKWQHDKFEAVMRLQHTCRKLELEDKLAKELKQLEEGRAKLQLTLADKERSRQYDFHRLSI